MKDYDKEISNFIYRWENDSKDDNDYYFRASISFYIVKKLYLLIRQKIIPNTLPPLQNFIFIYSIKNKFTHLFWYLIWSYKWIVSIRKVNRRKIIISSFMHNHSISKKYIYELLKYAHNKNYLIINFSVIYDYNAYKNKNILCFPHFLYKHKFKTKCVIQYSNELMKSIKYLSENIFPELNDFPKVRNIQIQNILVRDSFRSLLNKISKKNNILFFMQDVDYFGGAISFYYECKKQNIKTISFDHSIKTYNHLFNKKFTDIYLHWGNYQKNKLTNDKMITYCTGFPGNKFDFYSVSENSQSILYVLPSFKEPLLESIYRDYEYSLLFINELLNIIHNYSPKFKLIVRPHPGDRLKFPKQNDLIVYKDDLSLILNKVAKIFGEDSTLLIDLLKIKVPLFYITDKNGHSNLEFQNINSVQIINDIKLLRNKFISSDSCKYDFSERINLLKYYYGSKKFNLKETMNNCIPNI